MKLLISGVLIAGAIACAVHLPTLLPRTAQSGVESLSLAKLAEASDLTTQKAEVEVLVTAKIPGTIADSSITYLAIAEVRAGVDLSKVSQKQENGVTTVEIPQAQIQGVTIDVNRSKILASDRGFLNLGSDQQGQLVKEAQGAADTEVRIKAIQSFGILRAAEERAIAIVHGLASRDGVSVAIEEK